MAMNELAVLFGWMSVINLAILFLSTISVILTRGFMARLHSRLFGLDDKELGRIYFQYLSYYKLAIIILNITPYLALKLMT